MITFGPAGAAAEFAEEGHKGTIEMPKWLKERGLDVFEYPFGRGVMIKEDTARAIGDEFEKEGIEVTAHAPYFINFATSEEDKARNNVRYIRETLNALRAFKGKRCVFHPGSPLKALRSDAMNVLVRRVSELVEELYSGGYSDMYLCAETMGKKAQLGDLDEVIRIVNVDKMIIPCVDFGHLNARDMGAIKTKEDYKAVLDRLIDGVGIEKVSNMHIHFSKIQYSSGGEVRHLTFEDDVYGPDFEPLMETLYEYRLSPVVICESAGTQARDAKLMKDYYRSLL